MITLSSVISPNPIPNHAPKPFFNHPIRLIIYLPLITSTDHIPNLKRKTHHCVKPSAKAFLSPKLTQIHVPAFWSTEISQSMTLYHSTQVFKLPKSLSSHLILKQQNLRTTKISADQFAILILIINEHNNSVYVTLLKKLNTIFGTLKTGWEKNRRSCKLLIMKFCATKVRRCSQEIKTITWTVS